MQRSEAMTTDALLSHIAGHAGIPLPHAARAARAVLSGLGAYLTPSQRQLVAGELPESLGASLAEPASIAVPVDELLLEPGVTTGRARELVASVCRVLGEELSTQALLVLRGAVPARLVELLAWPTADLTARPAEPHRSATLASGRPGSEHPISETSPPARQSGSVAEPNPHGAAKLSSSPGTTQERRGETLAEVRPDAKHTLAGDPKHD